MFIGKISPAARTENVGVLWATVGTTVTELIWADSLADALVITFDNGITIEVPPGEGPRGTILGIYEGKHTMDDF